MLRSLLLVSVICLTMVSAIAQRKKGREDEPVKEFKEDLHSYRPKYEIVEEKKVIETKTTEAVVPKNDINKFLKDKLDSVYFYNKIICCADGYRVLIYVGNSSEEARTKRTDAYAVLPDEKSYTDYRQPSFKVKVGDYVDKLEAYFAYAKLAVIFPNAIVIPDKVNIDRDTK
jgi:hypothetical protein